MASLCAILFSRACVLFILVAFCDEKKEFTIFCGRALVRVRAKIEKNTLFGNALVRTRTKIKKSTIFDWALVRIRAKIIVLT